MQLVDSLVNRSRQKIFGKLLELVYYNVGSLCRWCTRTNFKLGCGEKLSVHKNSMVKSLSLFLECWLCFWKFHQRSKGVV